MDGESKNFTFFMLKIKMKEASLLKDHMNETEKKNYIVLVCMCISLNKILLFTL